MKLFYSGSYHRRRLVHCRYGGQTAALMRVIDDDELMRNEVMENEDF